MYSGTRKWCSAESRAGGPRAARSSERRSLTLSVIGAFMALQITPPITPQNHLYESATDAASELRW